jgi:TRAP-type mannitol/chloroaromatic compound transport system substrate-binding protein
MKKFYTIIIVSFMMIMFIARSAFAEPIKWQMITCWIPSMAVSESDKRFAKSVYELSGGRLQITVNSAGTIVPALSVFDAVSRGVAEIGSDSPAYWSGKNSAFDLLGSFPTALSQYDVFNWYFHSGGHDLYNYMYGKYNMLYFITSVAPMGSGIRSRQPIRTLADFRGKKLRMSGKAQGYILQKLGAAQLMMAGGDIYQALQMGTIDGAEFSCPSIDWSLGLGDVTKYNIGPGWNQPATVFGIMINRDAWYKLPSDLKRIVEFAANDNMIYMSSYYEAKNGAALSLFRDKGTETYRLSPRDMKQLEDWSWEYIVVEAQRNEDYDKVATSIVQYLKDFRVTRTSEEPFAHGRNPAVVPRLPHLVGR